MANLVNVIFYINEKESSIVFDPNNTIEDLKKVISLSQNMATDSFDLYYKGKKIIHEKLDLFQIVGLDIVPIFQVYPKSNSYLIKIIPSNINITQRISLKKRKNIEIE